MYIRGSIGVSAKLKHQPNFDGSASVEKTATSLLANLSQMWINCTFEIYRYLFKKSSWVIHITDVERVLG